ncbi:hypothetical protein Ancab_039269, partial [Ancistrocladus abbreviatus]
WGNLVSLDGSTSKKERLDVARILIATNHQTFISDSVQIVVDNKMFSLTATEEISGANIFKHMVVCNIDSNRKASVSLESGTGRNITGNNSPDQVSAKAEDVISEFQSPINDVLRQPEEEDNGEATLLKATDREVGQLRSASAEYAHGDKEHATGSYPINDKLNLFPEEVGSGGLKNGFRNMDLSASE